MEIHLWINSVMLAGIIFWLGKQALHQRQVIKDQSQKFTDLERYINIFRQMNEIAAPENVLKLLETEKMLLQQKNEVILNRQIENITKKTLNIHENKLNPKNESFINDSLRFIISYFNVTEFKTKTDRDKFIKALFPNNWEELIVILDKTPDKSPSD